MKALMFAASAAALAVAIPAAASAQTAPPTGIYANLGYAGTSLDHVDLGSIQGRLGYRFNNWLGVEGELSGGVKDDDFSANYGGAVVSGKAKIDHQEAIYGVVFLPLNNKWDLFARGGYGHTEGKLEDIAVTGSGGTAVAYDTRIAGDSWNYGAGAQWHWDGRNGIRADYTREEFTNGGGHADVWAVAFSHRF